MKERYLTGETYAQMLARPKENGVLWDALSKKARLGDPTIARAAAIRDRWHLLVISEDWCGDSINSLPTVARLVESAPQIDMRIIGRDVYPELMDAHLTGRSRSIPVIIVLDKDFIERGWWGPRPRQLQKWVIDEGLALPKDERYREVRTWYARDRGEAVANEILDIIERVETLEERAQTAG